MKKILALVLALCMALAAIPAMAEDVSGTWYVIMFGLTAGSLELNAEGTCAITMTQGEEPQTAEGTWTADGDSVVITIQDTPMALTFDGTNLIPDLQTASALGGMDMSGLDASLISSLLVFSREAAPISAADFTAWQADGTLPEGVTQEDMEAVNTNMQAIFFMILGSMSSSQPEQADMELTVLEDNFYVRPTYSGQEGVYIAKVQNANDVPVVISGFSSSMILTDADGNTVGEASYMWTVGSTYLEPGEITFISFVADVNEGATAEGYQTSVKCSTVTYETADSIIEVESADLRTEETEYYTSIYGTATVTNTGDSPRGNIGVVIAVKDQDGKLLDVGASNLWSNELCAGSSIIFVDSVSSNVIEYCEANGLTLTSVEAYAWAD